MEHIGKTSTFRFITKRIYYLDPASTLTDVDGQARGARAALLLGNLGSVEHRHGAGLGSEHPQGWLSRDA